MYNYILIEFYSFNGYLWLNHYYGLHIENNIVAAESLLAATKYIFVHRCLPI